MALDFLVCSAIATLSIKVFALYLVPMVVTIAVVVLVNLFVNFYFSWKVFDEDWFERALGSYGLESGVLATGLMLLRVVDPEFKTSGQESAADQQRFVIHGRFHILCLCRHLLLRLQNGLF